jgi:hypothetical protein
MRGRRGELAAPRLASPGPPPSPYPPSKQYDEPVINMAAVQATFGAFGKLFGGKK